jgi:hypothetical protein
MLPCNTGKFTKSSVYGTLEKFNQKGDSNSKTSQGQLSLLKSSNVCAASHCRNWSNRIQKKKSILATRKLASYALCNSALNQAS